MHKKLSTTQLACNYTNKLSHQQTEHQTQKKHQTSRVIDRINHYSFLNLCNIHNQVTESSALS